MSRKKRLLIILFIVFFVGCNNSILSMLTCKRTYKPLTEKKTSRGVVTKIVNGKSTYFGLSNEQTIYVIGIDSGRKWDITLKSKKLTSLSVGDSVDFTIKR